MNRPSAFFPGIDGRSSRARRLRNIYSDLSAAVGFGENPNTLQSQLCRRASTLIVLLEGKEAVLAAQANGSGSSADLDLYIRGVGTLMRVLASLKLQAKPNGGDELSLEKYLGMKAAAKSRKTLDANSEL